MPEIYIHHTPDVYIRVWEITEPESFFKDGLWGRLSDQSRNYEEIKDPSNRLQYLASRKLIAECFKNESPLTLQRKESRQLYISEFPEAHFSISHTEGYAGIISAGNPCGIDLEAPDRNVQRIKHKFMRDDEKRDFPEDADAIKIWSAKECIFKIFGQGEVDFLKHIQIHPGSDDTMKGRFENSHIRFESLISVIPIKNLQLVWGVGTNFVEL